MRHPLRSIVFVLVIAGAVAGCETETTIPADAQVVRVTATDHEVRLDPGSVHAGDVYLVLDLPKQGTQLGLIRGSASADGGGPLSEADLARLAQDADTSGIVSESLDVSCCGNVDKETLAAGKYAFILHDPDITHPGLPPVALAVLDVVP